MVVSKATRLITSSTDERRTGTLFAGKQGTSSTGGVGTTSIGDSWEEMEGRFGTFDWARHIQCWQGGDRFSSLSIDSTSLCSCDTEMVIWGLEGRGRTIGDKLSDDEELESDGEEEIEAAGGVVSLGGLPASEISSVLTASLTAFARVSGGEEGRWYWDSNSSRHGGSYPREEGYGAGVGITRIGHWV